MLIYDNGYYRTKVGKMKTKMKTSITAKLIKLALTNCLTNGFDIKEKSVV